MTLEEAKKHASRLNETGKHRATDFYYVACHDGGNEPDKSRFLSQWFVMRRPKGTPVKVAVFADGKDHPMEKA